MCFRGFGFDISGHLLVGLVVLFIGCSIYFIFRFFEYRGRDLEMDAQSSI